MFVLGLDPGLTRTGFGVVRSTRGGPVAERFGVLRTEPDRPVPARLAELADDLDELLAEVRPDVVALERVFVRRNLTNAMSVARASGVAMLCAARAGVALHEYTPSEVKATVAGDGAADKGQVARLVASRLGLDEAPRPADAADALAVALCHLAQARFGAAAS
ncbi:MAG: crossover junction endodeoxyribonuclease RuvC [Acidimicrobiia bacterium]